MKITCDIIFKVGCKTYMYLYVYILSLHIGIIDVFSLCLSVFFPTMNTYNFVINNHFFQCWVDGH